MKKVILVILTAVLIALGIGFGFALPTFADASGLSELQAALKDGDATIISVQYKQSAMLPTNQSFSSSSTFVINEIYQEISQLCIVGRGWLTVTCPNGEYIIFELSNGQEYRFCFINRNLDIDGEHYYRLDHETALWETIERMVSLEQINNLSIPTSPPPRNVCNTPAPTRPPILE